MDTSKLQRGQYGLVKMAAARYVRKERYCWPGGYLAMLVLSDGALLCPDCVTANFHEIADANRRHDTHGGWAPVRLHTGDYLEDPEYCGHCNRDLTTL